MERVGPSVVGIGERWRGGCGVVVGQDRVVTNAHNVDEDGTGVVFADGRTERARLLGVDPDGDLAVLEAPTGDAPALAAGRHRGAGDRHAVVAVARAADGGTRATVGYVSSVGRGFRGPRGRRVSGALEHTAPLAPGSSGSPIVALDGTLLGLNTSRLDAGFYLALPTDAALAGRLAALGRGESPRRRRLGVGLAQTRRPAAAQAREPARTDGALVRSVEDGSPAARAGIAQGDLVVAAGGRPVRMPMTCSRPSRARARCPHAAPGHGRAHRGGDGMTPLASDVSEALGRSQTIDITTTGRRSRSAAAHRGHAPQHRRAAAHHGAAGLPARLARQPARRPGDRCICADRRPTWRGPRAWSPTPPSGRRSRADRAAVAHPARDDGRVVTSIEVTPD
ncbi:MAG: S1C family serine protease [Chloroflexota bacterium]